MSRENRKAEAQALMLISWYVERFVLIKMKLNYPVTEVCIDELLKDNFESMRDYVLQSGHVKTSNLQKISLEGRMRNAFKAFVEPQVVKEKSAA